MPARRDQASPNDPLLVGVVGPCAAGKSTLVAGFSLPGYRIKSIAQEHSYVADMWQRLTRPDYLVYLHVSYNHTIQRLKLNWTEQEYLVQLARLQHARRHADLVIDTDDLTPQEVVGQVVRFLKKGV